MSKTRLAKFGNDNCIFKTAGGSNAQKLLKERTKATSRAIQATPASKNVLI